MHEFQQYEVAVKGWSYSYSFSIYPEYRKWDQYNRFDSLEITGALESSNPKASKEASITLSGIDPEELEPRHRPETNGRSIGYIQNHKNSTYYYVLIPRSDLDRIMLMIQAKQLQYIAITAEPIYRNKALIIGVRISKEKEE